MINTYDVKWFYRKRYLAGRLRLPFEDVCRKSKAIMERFVCLNEYRAAKRIALYASFRNEVLTNGIFLHALSQGKEVFFPRVVRGVGLSFYRIEREGELSPGSYSILEPQSGQEWDVRSMDLVVVPGVVFDVKGHRIGYGKGYYDRTLKDFRGSVVGLAYEMQVLEEIPHYPHDVRIHLIVTEKRTIRCLDMGG